jgi:hypothetical protein
VRLWACIPFLDRSAYQWMWANGGFLVFPPDHAFSTNGIPDGPPDDA